MELEIKNIGGASLIEYEEDKYKIVKNKSFVDLDNPAETDEEDKKVHVMRVLAEALYSEIDSLNGITRNYENADDLYNAVDLSDILTSVIVNAELHGNKYAVDKTTWIEYEFNENTREGNAVIEFRIRDEGKGFDYGDVRKSEEIARRSTMTYNQFRDDVPEGSAGLGLFNVIRYCDSIEWNGSGNMLVIRKELKRKL